MVTLVGKMPTTCAVVGCHNRQSKQCRPSFYRFPKHKDHRRLWIALVARRNPDGSSWQPSSGDRVCSDHFISKRKSDLPSSPDFMSSVHSYSIKELDLPGCSTRSEVSYRRFERAQTRTRLQEQHSKALEKNRQEVELSKHNEMVFSVLSHTTTPVTHEQHSNQELTSDKRWNENKELNREPERE